MNIKFVSALQREVEGAAGHDVEDDQQRQENDA
jgi:hypothetical protein